ncbi:hypothetical protein DOTSEDRAFT_125731 [Dothistroma septosporum NZE10]|uniref:DRBM domain-containing protein n=1 Tax=Dothistroma septosporum (strain NZE10 / CBS 128990) TaxID=675120 RepID=N1PW10_DOTSN|nr:hypothetical protein DOTSEDRAFT_125731 [Dothistroma septosporum NZE10]
MACQDRGLQSVFSFREREQGCFYVLLEVNGQDVDEVGPYASKRDAKEAICEKNLSRLEEFGTQKKRRNSAHQQGVSLMPLGFEDENWIGVLTGYLQMKQLPPAEYGPSGLHPSMGPWFCTVRFSGSPLTPFGHGMGPFARKDEAKKVAAMQAVHWLRQQGMLDQSTNKRRRCGAEPTVLAPGDTGLSQSVQHLAVKSENSPPRNRAIKSLPQQVHDTALRLGFTQPAFPTEQLEGSFVNMWAIFNPNDARKEPKLTGEVCRIGPIYGKKTAKDECCRELLGLLGEIEQARRALI